MRGAVNVVVVCLLVVLVLVAPASGISAAYTRPPYWANYMEPDTLLASGVGMSDAQQILTDSSGLVYVAGITNKNPPYAPTIAGPHPTPLGGDDGFLAVFDPLGYHLMYFTYLGGAAHE